MSQANPAAETPPAPAHARSNVVRLTAAQALAGANSVVVYATGSIVGNTLAPSHALATLPISTFVIGMAACTLPAGAIAQRHGRRAAFLAGAGCGVLAGMLAAVAVVHSLFWLFCLATFCGGAYAAVVLSFRFAAADCVPLAQRARALSLVMGGGVLAGVIGPQLVTGTMDIWPSQSFAVTYLAQAGVAVLCALILAGVRLPPSPTATSGTGRPLAVIARQPTFMTAVVCGVVAFVLMNFLMTAAPLAMRMCGITQAQSNLGIQWHVIAMYGPGFFTGRLIARWGAHRVILAGFACTAMSIGIGLLGVDIGHFWLSLILLGLGWNFGFIGASALVLHCHHADEKAKVQAFNDFAVFAAVAAGSLLSGGVLTRYGWTDVLWLAMLPLVLATLLLLRAGSSAPVAAPVRP